MERMSKVFKSGKWIKRSYLTYLDEILGKIKSNMVSTYNFLAPLPNVEVVLQCIK